MIRVERVGKAFGATQALDGIDMTVPPGTVLGLLGPNGAGKTTLVRILATLLAPDSGSVQICGVDVERDPHVVRTLIGLAGQSAAVDEMLTGHENLVMTGRLYRLDARTARARADEILERLDLADAGDRLVRTYSGGMKRRLDVGACLVGRPRVLLLDEPTTGLDPRSRLEVWAFIRELVAAGTTVLLTTQYLEEADHLADRIVVIDRGRVIACGTPTELKHLVAHDRLEVEVADGEVGAAARLLSGIGGDDPQPLIGSRIRIPVEHPVADLMAALRVLDAAGITPLDIGLRHASLDDVFLALTGSGLGEPEIAGPVGPRA